MSTLQDRWLEQKLAESRQRADAVRKEAECIIQRMRKLGPLKPSRIVWSDHQRDHDDARDDQDWFLDIDTRSVQQHRKTER
jgi:hypothetical protein